MSSGSKSTLFFAHLTLLDPINSNTASGYRKIGEPINCNKPLTQGCQTTATTKFPDFSMTSGTFFSSVLFSVPDGWKYPSLPLVRPQGGTKVAN